MKDEDIWIGAIIVIGLLLVLSFFDFSSMMYGNYGMFPQLDLYTHNSDYLWNILIEWNFDPHFSPFYILSIIFIAFGFLLLANSWKVLYNAQSKHGLASSGYYYIRHPQYVGFIIIMLGFLLQWPTLLTLVMFPILVIMYLKLEKIEEREAIRVFGNKYKEYMRKTPAFISNHLNKMRRTD